VEAWEARRIPARDWDVGLGSCVQAGGGLDRPLLLSGDPRRTRRAKIFGGNDRPTRRPLGYKSFPRNEPIFWEARSLTIGVSVNREQGSRSVFQRAREAIGGWRRLPATCSRTDQTGFFGGEDRPRWRQAGGGFGLQNEPIFLEASSLTIGISVNREQGSRSVSKRGREGVRGREQPMLGRSAEHLDARWVDGPAKRTAVISSSHCEQGQPGTIAINFGKVGLVSTRSNGSIGVRQERAGSRGRLRWPDDGFGCGNRDRLPGDGEKVATPVRSEDALQNRRNSNFEPLW
jgi:hypothetical protein